MYNYGNLRFTALRLFLKKSSRRLLCYNFASTNGYVGQTRSLPHPADAAFQVTNTSRDNSHRQLINSTPYMFLISLAPCQHIAHSHEANNLILSNQHDISRECRTVSFVTGMKDMSSNANSPLRKSYNGPDGSVLTVKSKRLSHPIPQLSINSTINLRENPQIEGQNRKIPRKIKKKEKQILGKISNREEFSPDQQAEKQVRQMQKGTCVNGEGKQVTHIRRPSQTSFPPYPDVAS